MSSKSSNKLSILIKPENFSDLVSKIEDLTKISDTIKMKIDSENIFMYSMMGESIMLAFKNYEIKTKDYFEIKNDIDYILNIVITGSKKFVKNLAFIKTSEKIQMDVTHKFTDEENVSDARVVVLKNGKFKLQIQTGENSEIRDINKSQLTQRLNFKNRKWSFNVINSDFLDVKKLSSINSDETRKVLHLNIEDNKVKLSEVSLWELEVDDVSESDKHLIFNKNLLSSINDNGKSIEFHVFETFILIKDDISSLMISFEQTLQD